MAVVEGPGLLKHFRGVSFERRTLGISRRLGVEKEEKAGTGRPIATMCVCVYAQRSNERVYRIGRKTAENYRTSSTREA